LSEHKLNQILKKYRTEEGMIDYKSFCANIEQVFYEEEAAQDALDKNKSKPVIPNLNILESYSSTKTNSGTS
jgi:hypothetical protein